MKSSDISRTDRDLGAVIDHAVLHPAATAAELIAGCETAMRYETAAFCTPSSAVPLAVRHLRGSAVKPCTVVGFPHGNAVTAAKIHEAIRAVEEGALEVDMVINIGWAKDNRFFSAVDDEIAAIQEAVTERGAILKVIFETCFLNETQIVRLCESAVSAGAAFVKTSTGFGTAGASEAHVALMKRSVPPETGIKASGGIRTLSDVERMLDAGASRIGTSSTVAILEEIKGGHRGPSLHDYSKSKLIS